MQYHYKRNLKVSTITAVPGHASDPGLLELALRLMKAALAKAPADAPRLADPFLADFQTRLEQAVANTEIRIIGAEPMQYRLHVEFAESGNRARIDFVYTDKKTWTTVQEVNGPGSTNGLIFYQYQRHQQHGSKGVGAAFPHSLFGAAIRLVQFLACVFQQRRELQGVEAGDASK